MCQYVQATHHTDLYCITRVVNVFSGFISFGHLKFQSNRVSHLAQTVQIEQAWAMQQAQFDMHEGSHLSEFITFT